MRNEDPVALRSVACYDDDGVMILTSRDACTACARSLPLVRSLTTSSITFKCSCSLTRSTHSPTGKIRHCLGVVCCWHRRIRRTGSSRCIRRDDFVLVFFRHAALDALMHLSKEVLLGNKRCVAVSYGSVCCSLLFSACKTPFNRFCSPLVDVELIFK